MIIFIICFSIFITYYLVQRQKINRQEKQDYLEEKKQQRFEELLKIAREEDKKIKKNKNSFVTNQRIKNTLVHKWQIINHKK